MNNPAQWQHYPQQQETAFSAKNKSGLINKKTITIVASIIVITVLLAGIFLVKSFAFSGGGTPPKDIALHYLEALNKGNAEEAISYGAIPPPNKDFLTDEILKQQITPGSMKNIKALSTRTAGNSAKVDYSLNLDGKMIKGTFSLFKISGQWKLEKGFTVLSINQISDEQLRKDLAFYGKRITDPDDIFSFPGKVTFSVNNPEYEITIDPHFPEKNLGFPTSSGSRLIFLKYSIKKEYTSVYQKRIESYVRFCFNRKILDSKCPNAGLYTDSINYKHIISFGHYHEDNLTTSGPELNISIEINIGDSDFNLDSRYLAKIDFLKDKDNIRGGI